MRKIILALLLMATQINARSQQRIFLYPSSEGIIIKGFDTTAPFMDYYPSNNPSTGKTAVLICPGGGYAHLAWDKEGTLPARFFNENGISFAIYGESHNKRKKQLPQGCNNKLRRVHQEHDFFFLHTFST